MGGVDASNQYEFYNYSPSQALAGQNANPQEVGNQYFTNGVPGTQALAYLAAFSNNGAAELYNLNSSGGGNSTQQVAAAIQFAVQDCQNYLKCSNSVTSNNGRLTTEAGNGAGCGLYYLGNNTSNAMYATLFDQLD